MKKQTFLQLSAWLGICLTLWLVSACSKQEIKLTTTDDVNMTDYFENNPDSFSLFYRILQRTETDAFLNAYGAYTCFAPTNSGVQKWLAKIGASSVEAADLAVLKDMVRFHLLEDTLTTASFGDGKLPVPTMFGQFLITGVSFDGANSSYIINRQALATKTNVRVGNGFIHEINEVLIPSSLTIAKQLEARPNFSIFVEALKATGYYDLLNRVDPDLSKRWYTVLAETNQALADSGFTSFSALRARYSNTGNPLLATDSLNMYVAYHVIPGLQFLGDIVIQPSYKTLLTDEVLSVSLINQQVVVNEVEFNGVVEKGITIARAASDNAATNGVWHQVTAHYAVKFRRPTAVYWDVSTFEEIVKLPAFYKKNSFNFVRQSEADRPLKDITWGWGSLASTNVFSYIYSTTSSVSNTAVNNDVNALPMGLPARPTFWEMTTPPIIKGRYKVWICYSAQRQSSAATLLCQVSINGTVLPRTMNFIDNRPTGTDAELEAIGWKRYTEATTNNRCGRLMGTYEFKTTDRHLLRIIPILGSQNTNNLDMIHFIPENENQILPRFRPDGSKIFF